MSDLPKNHLSRRDFFKGRFWRALGIGDTQQEDQKNSARSHLKRNGKKNGPHSPLVMRYPISTQDVAINDDSQNDHGEKPEQSSSQTFYRRTIPLFRPPGAVDEESFLKGCTRCNDCVDACPHDAIVHAPSRFREAEGTPMIDPDHQPCLMCDGFPCVSACEPNVLTSNVPIMMGTAMVTEHLCLAHHGTTCTVCSERCPVENAIALTEGKPSVNEDRCTGCGVCRFVCPAPENAILMMPVFNRPSIPEKQINE